MNHEDFNCTKRIQRNRIVHEVDLNQLNGIARLTSIRNLHQIDQFKFTFLFERYHVYVTFKHRPFKVLIVLLYERMIEIWLKFFGCYSKRTGTYRIDCTITRIQTGLCVER